MILVLLAVAGLVINVICALDAYTVGNFSSMRGWIAAAAWSAAYLSLSAGSQ